MRKKNKKIGDVWNMELMHIKLVLRLAVLAGLCIVFGVLTTLKIAFQGLDPVLSLIMILIGFALGYYVFFRTEVIIWDEKKEVISVGKMDVMGVIVFICYFGFEFLVNMLLKDRFDTATTVTGLTLSIFFGTLFGRLINTLISIRKTHEENV